MLKRLKSVLLLLSLSSSAAAGQLPQQLVGTWRLDNSRSNGVGPNVQLRVTITPHPMGLSLESRFNLPTGLVVLTDTMRSDGQQGAYTWKRPNGQEGRGLRKVTVLPQGLGIEISDSVSFDTPQGPQPRWTTQKWTIDTTAGTLTQDIEVRVPFSRTPVRNVFVKENP